MSEKNIETVNKTLKKPVVLKHLATDKVTAVGGAWMIKGKRRNIHILFTVSRDWPEGAKIVIDTTAMKGDYELNLNHQCRGEEHVLVIETIVDNMRKESMLVLKDIDILHVNVDGKAKIDFKAEVNGIQFVVRPSRDERISFNENKNALNFFNGFRKINIDLSKKLHVELNADQIIDDIRI